MCPCNDDHVVLVKDYRSKVEDELSDVCSGILKILESNLVPSASTAESKVFYLKMKGDYHRYLAEFKVGDERKEAAEQTMNSYKAAQDIAEADMAPTHPIRLGLALNFSVFYYEILNSSDKACSMAKQYIIIAVDNRTHSASNPGALRSDTHSVKSDRIKPLRTGKRSVQFIPDL